MTNKVPGIHYSVSPEAQAIRRGWLERESMLAEMRKARDDDKAGGLEYVKALGLIRTTEYLQTTSEERVALIDGVLAALEEVTQES